MFSPAKTVLRNTLLLTSIVAMACADEGPVVPEDAPTQSGSLADATARVVRRQGDPPEIGRVRLQGIRLASGRCRLGHTASRASNGEPLAYTVAEYYPDSCEFVVATHDWEAYSAWYRANRPGGTFVDRINERRRELKILGSRMLSQPELPDGIALAESQTTSRSATLESCSEQDHGEGGVGYYTEDPIFLNTTEGYLETAYTYTYGVCIGRVQSWLWSNAPDVGGPTLPDWDLQAHYHPNPGWIMSGWAKAEGQSNFINTQFASGGGYWGDLCPTSEGNTYIEYEPILTMTRYDSQPGASLNYDEYGACASYLHTTWAGY